VMTGRSVMGAPVATGAGVALAFPGFGVFAGRLSVAPAGCGMAPPVISFAKTTTNATITAKIIKSNTLRRPPGAVDCVFSSLLASGRAGCLCGTLPLGGMRVLICRVFPFWSMPADSSAYTYIYTFFIL
jgi:hypothetical protein